MDIQRKEVKGKVYYYLEHSFRLNGRVEVASKYLGSEIPKNIEELKFELLNKVNQKKWFDDLNNIKKNFSEEFIQYPTAAKSKYFENFAIKFTYDSTKIEGSTLTLKETSLLLQEGITPRNRPIKDVAETTAHKNVFELVLAEKGDFNQRLVLTWHKELFKDVDTEIAGKVRNHPVGIAG